MDAVLNWLVQGSAVALAAAAALRAIPRSRTQARYAFVWAASLVVVLLPVWSFVREGVAQPAIDGVPVPLDPVVSMPAEWWTSSELALGLWIAWCGVSLARLLLAYTALRAAKRHSVACPPEVEMRLPHWCRLKAKGRRTRLVLSTEVRSAAVLGAGSPVIAVTPSLVDELSDSDLDRVVIHEWAHVQRRDDLAQPAQLLISAVAGWHPAIWWLHRQLNFEREVACDEIAIAATGSAKGYASCLATLASLPPDGMPALPVLSAASTSGLGRRLGRILAPTRGAAIRRWRAMAFSASTGLAVLAVVLANFRVAELAASSLALPVPVLPIVGSAIVSEVDAALSTGTASASSSLDARRARPAREQAQSSAPSRGAASPPQLIREPDIAGAATVLPPAEARSADSLTSRPLSALTPSAAGVESVLSPPSTSIAPDSVPPLDSTTRTPWTAAADAGVAIGRGSQSAGVATAGFFRRVGKKIAASF